MEITTLQVRLLVLALILLKAHGILFKRIGSVVPDDPFVFVGETLNLTCYYEETEVHHFTDVHFTRNQNERMPEKYLHRTNFRQVTLMYPVTSLSDFGNYVCKVNKTLSGRLAVVNNQQVRVDYFPVPVKEIDCVVYDWANLTCTWNLTVEYKYPEYTNVSLVWALTEHSQQDCKRQTRTTCAWWEHDVLDSFKTGMTYYMRVSVTNTKRKGMQAHSPIFRINTMDIVKPAPVGSLRATPHNSTCILLQWSNLRNYRTKKYLLSYKSEWDSHRFVWITPAHPQPQEIFYMLCGLRPYTMHDLTVSCKPEREGFQSDPRSLQIRTTEDVPGAMPGVHPGTFMETRNCDADTSCRNITVYWKPIEPIKRNGIITSYRLLYRRSNDSMIVRQATVHGNVSAHSMKLQQNMDYVIEITGRTSKGPSRHSAKMYIPKSMEMLTPPDAFVVEASNSSSTTVMLRWSPVSEYLNNDIYYLIFYCLSSPLDYKCAGEDIEWIPIQSNSSRFPISLSGRVSYDYYIFGIAVMKNNLGSGILWNKCIYLKNEKPRLPPPNIKVENSTQRALLVRWSPFDCSQSRAYITSYIIYYCVVNGTHQCSGPQMIVPISGRNISHYINELTPEMKYKVIMQAMSDAGSGVRSEPIYGIVRAQDYDFYPLVISLSVIATLIICISLFLIIRKVKNAANLKLDIQLPEPNHDFPLPGDSRNPHDYMPDHREHLNTDFPAPPTPPSRPSSPTANTPLIATKNEHNAILLPWQKNAGCKETNSSECSASSLKNPETDTDSLQSADSRSVCRRQHHIPDAGTLLIKGSKQVFLDHYKITDESREMFAKVAPQNGDITQHHYQKIPFHSRNRRNSYSKVGEHSDGSLINDLIKSISPQENSSGFSSNGTSSAGFSWPQNGDNSNGSFPSKRDVDTRCDSDYQTTMDDSFDSVYNTTPIANGQNCRISGLRRGAYNQRPISDVFKNLPPVYYDTPVVSSDMESTEL